ncbi:DUF3551 domain-containing protein [Bradyrhizobium yuanmingense]|uniref:DUF3551 domain-containing protein n=1 Tax=Bradyrhizobium yuanmingense TaxID=108015 RepID=UPI00135F1DFE|nr:DUF3551 domain-containing protein [Bradyrhizobium yuanmingense]
MGCMQIRRKKPKHDRQWLPNRMTAVQETTLSKLFTLLSIVFVGLAGADYLSVAPATSKSAYGYCLQDHSSDTRTCGFDILEQCIVLISGRGGSCARSPYPAREAATVAN